MNSRPQRGAPTLRAGAVSHAGAVRSLNEDAHFVSPWLCVVADGMGGHEGGELASRAIVECVAASLPETTLRVEDLDPLIERCNREVRALSERAGLSSAGSTLVGVALVDNGGTHSLVVFNVGDSRCYRLAGGRLEQVSTDHSHVQELIDGGDISADDARDHPMRHVVTRALGVSEGVAVDYTVLAEEECRLLLCSDGVSGELSDASIAEILCNEPDPQRAALMLIESVLAGPARDNATALVVDAWVGDSHVDTTRPPGSTADRDAEITAPRDQQPEPATSARRDRGVSGQ